MFLANFTLIDGCIYYNDLTATSLGMMVSRGDYPQMTLFFRLVNYCNLPIYIYIHTYFNNNDIPIIFPIMLECPLEIPNDIP